MQPTFPLRKRSDPRKIARRIVEAVPRGTVLATSDGREALKVAREIDVLVKAALPEVQSAYLPRSGDWWWLWWLGEMKGVAGISRPVRSASPAVPDRPEPATGRSRT